MISVSVRTNSISNIFQIFKNIIPILVFVVGFQKNICFAAENEDTIWIELKKDTSNCYPIENLKYCPLKKPKVALVLSGGGARGFAHIGVLKAFEENQIDLDLIVGTSIGSIVGGFFSAGYSAEQIQKIAKEIDWDNIISDATSRPHLFLSQKSIPRRHILQLRLDGVVPYIPQSIIQGQNVYQSIYKRLARAEYQAYNDFDRLEIPFRTVATDIVKGKKVVIGNGDLAEAIFASVAFPLLFAPVEVNGMLLVDGGITDNLPVDVAEDLGSNIIVAVDATSPLRLIEEMRTPWEIADQVTTIMMENPTRESLQKADIAIKPQLENHRAGDFSDIDSVIQIGYQAGLRAIDSLKMLIEKANRKLQGENSYLGRVTKIKFEGDSSFFQNAKGINLSTKIGGDLFKYDMQSDIEHIYESGFCQDVNAKVLKKNSECQVIFYLNKLPRIRQIFIHHHNIIPDSIVTANFQKFKGRTLNLPALQKSLDNLKTKLIQKGYSLTEIENIRFYPDSAKLEFDIDEGMINEIRIEGDVKTRKSLILREFPIREGDFYKADLAIQGLQNIYSTELFDRVRLNLEKQNDQNILIIKVKEKKYLLMRLGGNLSLEREANGFVEFLHDNFLGSGIKFSAFGAMGDYMKQAIASLYTTRLLSTYLTTNLSFYYIERQDRYLENYDRKGNYLTIRRGGKFMLGQQIGRLGLISLQLRLENVYISSDYDPFPYSEQYRLRSLIVRSEVDKRDRLPFPEKGIFNRWFWETGNQRILGGNTSFTRIFLGLEGYYQFLKWFNYHPFIFAGSADITLPFSEFFYFGGQKDFPGLYENEKFGRQFVKTGLELRYQINWDLPIEAYILSRYTTGAVWERPDEKIEGSDFLHSISASFAINSFIGPIQATYGYLLHERSMFYLSLGFDF